MGGRVHLAGRLLISCSLGQRTCILNCILQKADSSVLAVVGRLGIASHVPIEMSGNFVCNTKLDHCRGNGVVCFLQIPATCTNTLPGKQLIGGGLLQRNPTDLLLMTYP
ncbi:hypothetical protein GDO78_018614 [Eleutherodactylus coqui]|uniref:Uncharacterized protein n=1 Tax=Eleutherodactylus coqui TaxID=57060 RepID=A0A8J6ECK7_ELECQ|nr:hypothetical protein GDO78_018614 [Eleutherodactylus coqui]